VAASSRDEDFGPRIREVKISGEKIMACNTTECGYCRFSIAQGQRWVREKVYSYTSPNGHEPIYQRYHAEVFAGETLSAGKSIKWIRKLPASPARPSALPNAQQAQQRLRRKRAPQKIILATVTQ
jgi:hypothetical protein